MANTDELIVYSHSRNGLGIRILGPRRGSRHSTIFIRQLLDNGLAQRDQRLKVADQLVSINEQSTVGISREHAVNLLRSAAATNEVRLKVRHPQSSRYPIEEYRRLVDQDNHQREESPRHTYDQNIRLALNNGLFQSVDLVHVMKNISSLSHDHQQLDGDDDRITLKQFEDHWYESVGERIDLLSAFVRESEEQLSLSQATTIEQLTKKVTSCERSQRLAKEIELEYEDLLEYFVEEFHRMKKQQMKQLQNNKRLIEKLFDFLSSLVHTSTDEQIFAQLKFEYEQNK